ncbi:MAG: efflux RND transporter permease subunit [Elusimicrobia bacterium]|nr:efflux RND transporter permease subunit [Elusimicrobiota bacterium]
MIKLFVKRPAMTLMFVLVFVVMGLVSFGNLIIERTPKMSFPFVTIRAVYSGASPEEIESQIVKKLEDAVAEISQIKEIQSFCYESFGLIFIEFEIDADPNLKAIEVKDKIEPVTNELPRDALKPVVARYDPTVEPIADLVLIGKEGVDSRDLYEYADKKLRNRISVIDGVASVEVYGGKERQINVKLDPLMMKKYFTTIDDVAFALDGRNVNSPGGSIETDDSKENIRFLGEITSLDELRNMVLVSREGYRFRLSDIGTVEDSFKKVETYTRYNGQDAVGLSIKKLSDGDAVSIMRKLRKSLDRIKKNLPKGMELLVAYDSTEFLLDDTKKTLMNILAGILLTVIILFLFLENIRVTVIAAVVIPTSLISAFFPMAFSGFTINFITLLAIATSLGTLIANALVVLESVDQQLAAGKDPVEAAVDGTKEASVAVFASAGTNLVVFTPIAFMGGIVGQFMRQFGLTVVYATIFSIMASFTLTPMLCALILRKRETGTGNHTADSLLKTIFYYPQTLQKKVLEEYKVLFNKIFKHPLATVVVSGLIFVSTYYPLKHIGSEFMSNSDMDMFGITMELPQGVSLDKTLRTAMEAESIIRDVPEVSSYLTYVGIDGSENASIKVNLKPLKTRKRSDMDIINALTLVMAKIPGADIQFTRGHMGEGGSMFGGDVSIDIYGTDYASMIEQSKKMMKIMEETGYFRSVSSSYKSPKDEIRFKPDDSKMIAAGISNSQVSDVIRYAVSGHEDNVFKEKGEEYVINISYGDSYKETAQDIADIAVMSKDGLLSISQLGTIEKMKGYSMIMRKDKTRVIKVNGYLSKSTAGQVQELLNEKFRNIEFPEGSGYEFVGFAEMMAETGREISKAFILAVIFTYMLLVSIMNSFKNPFVILSSVLTAFVGVFYLMFFLEFSINIGSMMALVMLVGLVVNNGILMLDQTMKEMDRGADVKRALWLGASIKFRAILMTSLAIIFGALPQIFDKFVAKSSIGAVIVGGILASIFFTFFLVPIIFFYANRKKDASRESNPDKP